MLVGLLNYEGEEQTNETQQTYDSLFQFVSVFETFECLGVLNYVRGRKT